MTWIDTLIPADQSDSRTLEALRRISLDDCESRICPGPLDELCLSVISRVLSSSGLNLHLQLPRGSHDVAILSGIYAKLIGLVGGQAASSSPRGPVVVVGMNTMVQDRLRRIRFGGIPLADGLRACRVRSDGQVVDAQGVVSNLKSNDSRILYLNTRVGWPRLNTRQLSVVIIDRTSFSSPSVLERSLQWAETHNATAIILISDLGDRKSREFISKSSRSYITWSLTRPLIDEVLYTCGKEQSTSSLSTNVLLLQDDEGSSAALCSSPAVDQNFREAHTGLGAAARIAAIPPYSLIAARKLFHGLSLCVGTVDEFNQWAALDHRVISLATLKRDIEQVSLSSFDGEWRVFGDTHWATVRHSLLQAYELIANENPKLYALVQLLEKLRASRPTVPIIVRVSSEAAGHALASNLIDFGMELSETGPLRWAPLASKASWTKTSCIEIYPGAPPPSRLPAFWSGESSRRMFLTYAWEHEFTSAAHKSNCLWLNQQSRDAFRRLALTGEPPIVRTDGIALGDTIRIDSRAHPQPKTIELDVDTSVLSLDIEESPQAVEIGPPAADPTSSSTIQSRPILLEPDGECLWVREGSQLEILIGDKYQRLPLAKIHPGQRLIVPRGEGRENLFQRLIAARHRGDDLKAFEVFFSRWRHACKAAFEKCSGSWATFQTQMRAQGSDIGWWAIRAWAKGDIIAPLDKNNIARVGRIAEDRLVEQQAARFASMASEVRVLHVKLGRLLSAAMSEAFNGGGPNLNALSALLDGVDASELIDEFELRRIRSIGKPQDIPATQVGKLLGTSDDYA